MHLHCQCPHGADSPRALLLFPSARVNIEFSSRPDMKPRTNRDSWLKATLDEQRSGGELQRFVRTQGAQRNALGFDYPMNLATDVLKIAASLIAMFLLMGRIPFSMFETYCFGRPISLPSCDCVILEFCR